MQRKKMRVVVGITTFCNEYLDISVRGVARLGHNFVLVIYNDNPNTNVSEKYIRKLGYRGKLFVINGGCNLGQLQARIKILEFAKNKKFNADWFVFVDDDDILTRIDIPDVSPDNFAVIQNAVAIRTRLIDVLRAMQDAGIFSIDNENVCLMRPNIGLSGTFVRFGAALQLAQVMTTIQQDVSDIEESLNFRLPTDLVMWSAMNIIARHYNDTALPIYMDSVNYIKIDIDTVITKYGKRRVPAKNAEQQIARVIERTDKLVRDALFAMNAAPSGQKLDA